VSEIIAASPRAAHTQEPVAQWRKTANELAAKQAGYAYQVYARSKAILVLDHLIALVCGLAELDPNSPVQTAMEMAIRAWADRRGAIAPEGSLSITDEDDGEHSWIEFLRGYDLGYRHRRLSFVMRGINELYARLDEPAFHDVTPQHLDSVKRQFQESLRRLRMLRSGEFASSSLRNGIAALLQRLPATTRKRGIPAVNAPPATVEDIDDCMRRLSEELDLAAFDRSVDHTAGSSTAGSSPAALHREVLVNYLGFSFWDVWTFPISEWHDLEEHREIRVDRISPIDATSLRSKEFRPRE
jgi:hypothetical protein